jgi:hypothetical protein
MKLPELTAEASLYQSDTPYRTNARTSVVGSSRRAIRTAQDHSGSQEDGGTDGDIYGSEVINVTGSAPVQCPLGWEQVGDTCVPPPGNNPRIPIPTGHGPKPKPQPKPRQTHNGLNGGNYNPTAGAPCCRNTAAGAAIILAPGNYLYTKNGWSCCTKFPGHPLSYGCDACRGQSGTSTVCADGGCPPGLDI